MRVIHYGKLCCRISPYKKKQCKFLEKKTSLFDKVYHKYEPYTGFMLPYHGENVFMTHNISHEDIKKWFPDYVVKEMPVIAPCPLTEKFSMKDVNNLWEAQSQILRKIEDTMGKSNAWFVNLQTGQGKTLLATYVCMKLGLKTWILCYSDNILEQWITNYREKTNIDPKKIIRVDGSILNDILAGVIDPEDFDIYLCTPTLLDRFGSSRCDYKKIEEIFNICGIGLLIYDEAHRNVSNIVKLNSVMDIKYQLYLSADFGQGDYEKEIMYKEIFKAVPVLTPSDELVHSMKYTKIIVMNFNTHPNHLEEMEPFNKYGYNSNLYMKYQFKKGIIKDLIEYILDTFVISDPNYRALILFTNIEHVDKMYKRIKQHYPKLSVGRFHGSAPPEEKRETKNHAKIIVATYGSFSTGLDAKDIKYVISTDQCNKVADNQSAGRVRPLSDNSDALYFMLVDNGFTYCKRKLKIRLAYLTKNKAKDDLTYSFNYHPDIHQGNIPMLGGK